jgi:hypothetical protein
MTPTERGIALAVEAVPAVARLHALGPAASPSGEDRFAFLVELRPYLGSAIAEAHYAILRAVGREAAARVTYGNAEAPSPTLLRRATELSLTGHERALAQHEAATRVLPAEEEPRARATDLYPLTLLIIDVDPSTASAVRSVANATDAITDSSFGMPLRALVGVAASRQYDVIFTSAPTSRRVERAALAGWHFFLEVTARNPSLQSSFVFVNGANGANEVLSEPARRLGVRTLTKPLEAGAVRAVLDAARGRFIASGAREEPAPSTQHDDAALGEYRNDVVALRAKGGTACERLADILEDALSSPEAYAASLLDKAEKDGPESARAVPRTAKEVLELLHATAKTLLSL